MSIRKYVAAGLTAAMTLAGAFSLAGCGSSSADQE